MERPLMIYSKRNISHNIKYFHLHQYQKLYLFQFQKVCQNFYCLICVTLGGQWQFQSVKLFNFVNLHPYIFAAPPAQNGQKLFQINVCFQSTPNFSPFWNLGDVWKFLGVYLVNIRLGHHCLWCPKRIFLGHHNSWCSWIYSLRTPQSVVSYYCT